MIQTWDLVEPTRFEGFLDGKAYTATSQWRGSGPTITEQGFLGADGLSGYFWSRLKTDELNIFGIYDGAALFMTPSGFQVRIGGAGSSAYSETANEPGRSGQRVRVELRDLIGPHNCPGTTVSGTLAGVVHQ